MLTYTCYMWELIEVLIDNAYIHIYTVGLIDNAYIHIVLLGLIDNAYIGLR